MFIRTAALVAATLAGLAAAPASAAIYDATSWTNENPNHHNKQVGDPMHSLWFSTTPFGYTQKRFQFENSSAGVGTWETTGSGIGSTASLTGIVKNAAGEGFEMMLDFVQVAEPTHKKNPYNKDASLWDFYELTVGMLNALNPANASFDLALNTPATKDLKVQVGEGANDKNANEYGLSTWITMSEKNCQVKCQYYKGDINILLDPRGGGTSVVPLPASIALLPMALGGMGLVGAARRRRKS